MGKRLVLPAVMLALLLLALAYWWLDNLPHEIFGTALFVLICWHVAINRAWFRNLFRGSYDLRRAFIVVMHLTLIVNMVVLLATSIAISQSIFAILPLPERLSLRDLHWFSAYWVMIVVGIHVGIHWARVMHLLQSQSGVRLDRPAVAIGLRIATAILAIFGVWSFSVLGLDYKLTLTYSIEFWDFTAPVAPFFGHWVGVVALPAIIAHSVTRRRKMVVLTATNSGTSA